MKGVLGVIQIRKKICRSNEGEQNRYYRFVLPPRVLKKLGISIGDFIILHKIRNELRIITTGKGKTRRIGTKGRVCIPADLVASLNWSEGDYLKYVMERKNDFRLRLVVPR